MFGLHTPHTLATGADPDRLREDLTSAVLHSLNSVLAEPIQDVLMEDSSGRLCIETKTTLDLERTLGMTAGNIFHGALSWPFAENDDPLDTPARRWGVATAHDRILLCGSGSRPRRCGVGYRWAQRRDGGAGDLGHRRGPLHVALEAEVVRHLAVAVPQFSVRGFVTASPRH